MDVDIERMSKETNILLTEIKEALGIPIVSIDTSDFEELRSIYRKSPIGSERRKAVLLKMALLFSTFEEIIEVYYKSSEGSEERKVALLKWGQFSVKEIENATNLKEAIDAYHRAPNNSEEKKKGIRRISTFFKKDIV